MQSLLHRCSGKPHRQRGSRFLLVCALLAWEGAACADLADAQSESRVKAAFLYKFLAYIEWPPSAFERQDTPLTLCVLEAEEVANELARVSSGRLVNARAIALRRLSGGESGLGCHALFIGSAAGSRLGRILGSIRSQPVLTVTELDDALVFGSVINFIVIDDQVRFAVSLPAAERGNIKISARLLTVAHQVLTVMPQ